MPDPTTTKVHEDVIVLVPGFLGFSLIGRFPYFADRLPATVAALFREKSGRKVTVVPASTVPTGRLRDRNAILVGFLDRLRTLGAKRLYLLGHSTGGLDAQLLVTTAPFWGGQWSEDQERVRGLVQAVVTISAPHYGTCLLDSVVGEFVGHPNLAGAVPFLKATGPLFALAVRDLAQVGTLMSMTTKQLPDAWRFVLSILQHHELLDELKPQSMEGLRERLSPDPRVRLACFATGADVQKNSTRDSDPFYAELVEFGHADDGKPVSTVIQQNIMRIADAPADLWICSGVTPGFRIAPGTNDGIVNTARQLLPGATLAGIVVADHADVLGDYDRTDLATDQLINAGIFHSGAGFGDDEFVELYRRVVTQLLKGAA